MASVTPDSEALVDSLGHTAYGGKFILPGHGADPEGGGEEKETGVDPQSVCPQSERQDAVLGRGVEKRGFSGGASLVGIAARPDEKEEKVDGRFAGEEKEIGRAVVEEVNF